MAGKAKVLAAGAGILTFGLPLLITTVIRSTAAVVGGVWDIAGVGVAFYAAKKIALLP
jgi:hypothetical protein